MTINERIRILRKSEQLNADGKMTAEKFAKRLGVGQSAISMIETGANSVTEQMVTAICREFDVNPEWLRDGVGPMFKEPAENELIESFIRRILTDEPEGVKVRFIAAVAKFDDRDWETVMKVADALVVDQEEENLRREIRDIEEQIAEEGRRQEQQLSEEKRRRQQLHEELDRQLDMEKNLADESAASEAG